MRNGARTVMRGLVDRVRAKLRDTWLRPEWFLAYHVGEEALTPLQAARCLPALRVVEPEPGRFWADPFPVVEAGARFILFEDYEYASGRGRISFLELTADGQPGRPGVAIDEDHHLSYPFPLRWQGELFLIPEASAARHIRAYRCRHLPNEWEPAEVLMADVEAVDATLVEADGRWWMFAVLAGEDPHRWSRHLHLFHAPSPLGPWTPHRANPVKSDPGSARPAGRLFRRGGRLYRPAQDCRERYGHAIVLHRVERLDRSEYRERPVGRIEPGWHRGLKGTHTVNVEGDLLVLDGDVDRLCHPWAPRT